MLSDDIESLINDLGKAGLNESTIKGRLALFQDQAQAQEADIAKKETDLKYAEIRITELEVQLHKQQQTKQGDRLGETTEKLLVMFFRHERATLEQAAQHLGIETGLAEYHADLLSQAEMITLAGITPAGSMFILTPKGRAYVVESELV
jgi:hypothetical protein